MSKSFLLLVCLFAVIGVGAFAQQEKGAQKAGSESSGAQVETNKDRFSGDVTIKIKPQLILDKPEQFITISMEAKFPGKRPAADDVVARAVEVLNEAVFVRFESQAKLVTDFGDQELHFIADGKRISKGKASGGIRNIPFRDPELKPDYKIREVFTDALSTEEFDQIANSNHVEMRLGKYEFTLSPAVLESFRDFAKEFSKYAPSSELKRKRP